MFNSLSQQLQLFDVQGLVAIVHHCGTVGDEDDGAVVRGEYVVEQLALGVGVEGTGGLVEEHDGAVAKECAGNGNALGLALAQSASLLAARCVESQREVFHEVGARHVEHLHHVVVGGRKTAQSQVVAYAATHERVPLWHIDEVAAQTRCYLTREPIIIYHRATALRRQQGQYDSHQGGLSSARLPEDGGAGARREVEREVAEHAADGGLLGIRILVGIADVLESDATGAVHLDGITLFLQRVLLEFHQALGGGQHGHELRHQPGEPACRSFNLVHQLQEGRHAAEGQRMVIHARGAPEEGDEVDQCEAEVEDEVAEHAEGSAFHHVLPQLALGVLQSVHHGRVALHRLDEHAVLNGLLQYALHPRVTVAHLTGERPHAPHVELAEEDEHRQQAHDDEGQRGVHGKEVEEGTEEQSERGNRARDGLGEEGDDVADVFLEAVDDVTAVHLLSPTPLRAQYAVEHALLHAVLRLDAEDVLHPYTADADGEVAEDEHTHDAHGPRQRALDGVRGHVDGMLHRPNLTQADRHAEESQQGVDDGLKLVAAPRPPEPPANLHDRVLAFLASE